MSILSILKRRPDPHIPDVCPECNPAAPSPHYIKRCDAHKVAR